MTDDWLHVMECAHSIGMESTATMVIGFGETMAQRIEHMEKVRRLQDKTGGFRAFITWTFQPGHTALGGEKTSSWDYMRTLALSRLYMDNIAHIQGSWVTQGERIGQLTLGFGADAPAALCSKRMSCGQRARATICRPRRWSASSKGQAERPRSAIRSTISSGISDSCDSWRGAGHAFRLRRAAE